jgi:F0F1-type ATP synthase membrane subunit b/b'
VSDAFYEGVATWSQVVASILFIIVMVVLWVRLIAPAVVASQARKNAELADAEARRDAAREQIDAAQREVTVAEEQTRSIAARAQADAARITEKITNDAAHEGDRVVKNAEGELERSRAAARDSLRADLLEKAIAIARGSAANLDAATDKQLVDEAVATADKGGSK